MTYERELTFALRLRGLTDEQIASALDVARVHVTTARSTMEEELGTPAEYAAQFPRSRHASLGRRVMITLALGAIAYSLFALVVDPIVGIDLEAFVGPVVLWPALVLLVVGVVGGFLLDYLRPVPRLAE